MTSLRSLAALLAFAFANYSASAGELRLTLNTHDSERLYLALHTIGIEEGDGVVAKRIVFDQGTPGDGVVMHFACLAKPRWTECEIRLESPDALAQGELISLPQWMAEGLVSQIDLDPRTDLGPTWKGFDSHDGRFSLVCEQVFTPTDLPIYTSCTTRMGKKPTPG